MNRLALLFGLLFVASPASGQVSPTRCTYDTCALRVIDGGDWFGTRLVVRGYEGTTVAPARRSQTLEDLFAADEAAAAYYARFESREQWADWLGWLGTGLMLAGFVSDVFGEGGLFSQSAVFYGGGLAVTYGAAIPMQGRADTELANAIWRYNRSLVSR